MPPEVQSTIIALAGLNKLSGGAISGIVGELGKGLIKGVLGINAGVVNVRGAVVNGGGGGIPGAAGAAGGAGLVATAAAAGAVAALGAAGTAALVYGIPAAVEAIYGKNPAGAMQTGGARTSAGKQSALTVQMFKGLMPSYVANIKAAGATALRSSKGTPHQAEPAAVYQPIKTSVLELQRKNETVGHAQQERIDSLKSTTAAKLDSVRSAITSAGRQVPQVSTNVTVNISAAGVSKVVTTHSRYGSPNGSYGSGSSVPHGAVL